MKPTLTIGISAYNEAKNIGALLAALVRQKIKSANLVEILVVSDASADDTDSIVHSFKDPRVRLIRLEKRSGVSHAQNIIMEKAAGEVLTLLDADVLPASESFIENLILPMLSDPSVGLTSGLPIPARPKTFVEKILSRNHRFKTRLFMSIGDGNNLYTCFGPSTRGFARALYSKIRIPSHLPNDAASYMFCITNGKRFVLARSAKVIFRSPSNLADHIERSSRFLAGKQAIIETFGEVGKKAYAIPRSKLLKAAALEFLFHPILFSSHVAISLYVWSRKRKRYTSLWNMASSTKKI